MIDVKNLRGIVAQKLAELLRQKTEVEGQIEQLSREEEMLVQAEALAKHYGAAQPPVTTEEEAVSVPARAKRGKKPSIKEATPQEYEQLVVDYLIKAFLANEKLDITGLGKKFQKKMGLPPAVAAKKLQEFLQGLIEDGNSSYLRGLRQKKEAFQIYLSHILQGFPSTHGKNRPLHGGEEKKILFLLFPVGENWWLFFLKPCFVSVTQSLVHHARQ